MVDDFRPIMQPASVQKTADYYAIFDGFETAFRPVMTEQAVTQFQGYMQGMAAMQKLNVLIINPLFLGVFVGTAGVCAVVGVVTFVLSLVAVRVGARVGERLERWATLVGGVILIDLGCEKTDLAQVEKYLLKREKSFDKPVAKIGIQEVGGTQAAIQQGLREVERMLPAANLTEREECSVGEIVLGVKCGGSDGFSGISANPSLGRAADLLVRSGGTVLITEVPEFCGAEHLIANRAKDVETGRAVYRMVDWYKEYALKFGAVLNSNSSPGNIEGGLLNITIKSLGAIAKAGSTRVEGVFEYAESSKNCCLNLMQGPGYDQKSTPGIVAAGATVVVFTTGRGTTIGNAIAPVVPAIMPWNFGSKPSNVGSIVTTDFSLEM